MLKVNMKSKATNYENKEEYFLKKYRTKVKFSPYIKDQNEVSTKSKFTKIWNSNLFIIFSLLKQ